MTKKGYKLISVHLPPDVITYLDGYGTNDSYGEQIVTILRFMAEDERHAITRAIEAMKKRTKAHTPYLLAPDGVKIWNPTPAQVAELTKEGYRYVSNAK
jgi:hypothetical protein